MDKYSKTLLYLLRLPIGIFCIILGVGFIGISFWVSTFSDVATMILLISLLGGGFLINFGLGYVFFNDQYKATHLVRDGNTLFTPVETQKFLMRRKIVTLVGFVSYVLLAIYYIVRAIVVGSNRNYYEEFFNTSPVALIIFAFLALFISVFFFLIYKKTKHIDLNEN